MCKTFVCDYKYLQSRERLECSRKSDRAFAIPANVPFPDEGDPDRSWDYPDASGDQRGEIEVSTNDGRCWPTGSVSPSTSLK